MLRQPEEVIVITERTYAYNTDLREAPASPGTQGTEDHHSTVGQAGRLKWRENMMAGLLHGRAKMSDHRLREECTDCSCSGRCIWPGQAREPKDHETDWSSYNTGRTPATHKDTDFSGIPCGDRTCRAVLKIQCVLVLHWHRQPEYKCVKWSNSSRSGKKQK